ncbi:hypothetical protein PhCBS80983_g05606 [Powellomyces hirtus]|uniref:Uncharacterized protein n=1 Tax=Powellomyces hirtus TaxID=109895 RepID=A0A507DTM2_9FUNG|nr:hypothetical protein PhCBS80983_g05606 [Powellomyces hirtus]
MKEPGARLSIIENNESSMDGGVYYSPVPTLPGTDRQTGLWYLIPHIWDSLWIAIPRPVRGVIASVSVPWLLFCIGTSISSAGTGTIASSIMGLVRMGQQAGFSVMSAAGVGSQGQQGSRDVGGFIGGALTAGALLWGYRRVKGQPEQAPQQPEEKGKRRAGSRSSSRG